MDNFILPTITMIAGSTHPVSFRVTDLSCSAVYGGSVTANFSVSHYINNADTPIFSLTKTGLDDDGYINLTIESANTVNLSGKYIYQLHLTNGIESEIYQGYLIVLANRNKDVF